MKAFHKLMLGSCFLLLASCTTSQIDILATKNCPNYGSFPRYPLKQPSLWLCRSIAHRGAKLSVEPGALRITPPPAADFKLGSSVVSDELRTHLDAIAILMQEYPELRAIVIGYTDPTGSKSTNSILAQRRASAAINYLISQGVAATQCQVGYHSENQQRRVDIVLLNANWGRPTYYNI